MAPTPAQSALDDASLLARACAYVDAQRSAGPADGDSGCLFEGHRGVVVRRLGMACLVVRVGPVLVVAVADPRHAGEVLANQAAVAASVGRTAAMAHGGAWFLGSLVRHQVAGLTQACLTAAAAAAAQGAGLPALAFTGCGLAGAVAELLAVDRTTAAAAAAAGLVGHPVGCVTFGAPPVWAAGPATRNYAPSVRRRRIVLAADPRPWLGGRRFAHLDEQPLWLTAAGEPVPQCSWTAAGIAAQVALRLLTRPAAQGAADPAYASAAYAAVLAKGCPSGSLGRGLATQGSSSSPNR